MKETLIAFGKAAGVVVVVLIVLAAAGNPQDAIGGRVRALIPGA